MQEQTTPVSSKSKVVGTATYKVYDSVAEAVKDMGEVLVLTLLNTQARTSIMNRIRTSATGSLSRKALYSMAVASLTQSDLEGIAGDEALVDAFMENRMAEIKTKIAKEAPVPSTEEEEEGEE